MKIFGRLLAAFLAVILLFGAFVFWASSGTVGEVAWVEQYDAAEEPPSAVPETLTVMTYNVGYMSGMTNNRPVLRDREAFETNLTTAADAIRRIAPDVIGFQEIDVRSSRSFDVDQVAALAERGGYSDAAVAVNWDKRYVPFPSAWPRYHFGKIVSGQAVLSRFPISEHRRIVLAPAEDAPIYEQGTFLARVATRFYIDRLAQVSLIDVERPIAIVNVHLEAFDAETRERQAEQLIEIYRELPAEYPVFLIGDFNSVMPAAKHAGRLDAASLERFRQDTSLERLLAGTGLTGALPESAYATRDRSTFTFSSADPHVTIDHILFESGEVDLIDAFVVDVDGPPSDHRPVVARFLLRR